MQRFPSIFNDVIGPVMRGPSSSHTAASWRIAKYAMQLLKKDLVKAVIEFDKDSVWANNYREQGTVLGMSGGLMNIDLIDSTILNAENLASKQGIKIIYKTGSFEHTHQNSVKMLLESSDKKRIEILAVSQGGGAIVIQKINGHTVNSEGDYHELYIWSDSTIKSHIQEIFSDSNSKISYFDNTPILTIVKDLTPFPGQILDKLNKIPGICNICPVKPIMPILSCNEPIPDYFNLHRIIDHSQENKISAAELGLLYEKHRSGLSEDELMLKMETLIDIIEKSIDVGLSGTDYDDRIYPRQSHLISESEDLGSIMKDSIINDIVRNVTAIMESKSAMEVIVANPTAGSSGTVGGLIKAVSDRENISRHNKLMAYFAAGLIGVYIAEGPGFSAEEHGCQVECGAASAMAAAAVVQLYGGTAEQSFAAASLALQNMIGLVCDPIADRVEAPCLGKNINAAVNALSSAVMARSAYMHLIPFKQVLDTVIQVSVDMPTSVKCTGLGGLAVTPAAKEIKKSLK